MEETLASPFSGAFCYITGMSKTFTLGKKERLKSRKQIDVVFAEGKAVTVFPVRVVYLFGPAAPETVAQIGVTVAKRHFKKAVDRNRLKRLLREAYRLQKTPLTQALKEAHKTGYFFFMYTDKTMASFTTVQAAMHQLLQKLQQKLVSIHEDIA